ncbi:proton-conducting transporter membrane subunit [uncultured Alistipes sp.]|uniref:proton-conducting transporter transmembrane domain-containing protein n=1 Tax=uncultured Alistipes sp. TaxID=538949 RepID=UPI00260AAFED|nr:proton-conducting transporter membrane subunit [uncultured Alistipes sp.]
MMLLYLLTALFLAACAGFARSCRAVRSVVSVFFGVQLLFALWLVAGGRTDATSSVFFTFDRLGMLFFVLMTVVSSTAFFQSSRYLDAENLHEHKVYKISLMLLCASASAVYFANNVAVTWIFLEATTLCTAGLVYHRRDERSLEATWKYIFVCSTGIAVAYLGILLLGTVAVGGDMSYSSLSEGVLTGNPLYLKIAFLFILVGYSCKMELFPLYTIGVDANFAAPTPASAVISTVLVNAGFVSVFRVYRLVAPSPVGEWASQVLVIAGVLSVLVGAVFLRRTNNYKRLLSYSTVENMGIVAIGLGIGGAGVFAALFHATAHTFIKSGLFFCMAQVGKTYGNYRINRIGDYIRINRVGAATILLGSVSLLAFPPSALFVSEVMIFKQIVLDGKWWLLAVMVLSLCFVMYSLFSRVLQLCFRPSGKSCGSAFKASPVFAWTGFALIAVSSLIGVLQPEALVSFIREIVTF